MIAIGICSSAGRSLMVRSMKNANPRGKNKNKIAVLMIDAIRYCPNASVFRIMTESFLACLLEVEAPFPLSLVNQEML